MKNTKPNRDNYIETMLLRKWFEPYFIGIGFYDYVYSDMQDPQFLYLTRKLPTWVSDKMKADFNGVDTRQSISQTGDKTEYRLFNPLTKEIVNLTKQL